MTILERLSARLAEASELDLNDCIECATSVILTRRFPFGGNADEKAIYMDEHQDLLYRVALDLYNKSGAEGEMSHSENGISRTYESSWVSEQLLREIVPKAKVIRRCVT